MGCRPSKVRLRDVHFLLHSQAAIEGDAKVIGSGVVLESNWLGIRSAKTVRLVDSTIDTSVLEGIDAGRVVLKSCTQWANGTGILARTSAKVVRSTLDNVGGRSDFDIRSIRRPRLIDSTCSGQSENYATGTTWGVCSGD